MEAPPLCVFDHWDLHIFSKVVFQEKLQSLTIYPNIG